MWIHIISKPILLSPVNDFIQTVIKSYGYNNHINLYESTQRQNPFHSLIANQKYLYTFTVDYFQPIPSLYCPHKKEQRNCKFRLLSYMQFLHVFIVINLGRK